MGSVRGVCCVVLGTFAAAVVGVVEEDAVDVGFVNVAGALATGDLTVVTDLAVDVYVGFAAGACCRAYAVLAIVRLLPLLKAFRRRSEHAGHLLVMKRSDRGSDECAIFSTCPGADSSTNVAKYAEFVNVDSEGCWSSTSGRDLKTPHT